jgi:hypothetical protein
VNRATDPERIALSFSFDSGEPMLVEMAVGIKMDIVPTNLAAQANGLRSQSSIGSTSVRLTQYADGSFAGWLESLKGAKVCTGLLFSIFVSEHF